MSAEVSAQASAAAHGALVHVRSDLGVLAVTGGERLSWLNGLVTQDIGKLAPGAGAYGLAVGKTGKMLAEIWFVAGADRVLVVMARSRMDAIRDHFDRHLVMEDAEMGPPLDRGVIFVHGPRADDLVAEARARGGDAARIDWTGRGDAAVVIAAEGSPDATVAALLARAGEGALATEAGWEALRVAWGVPRRGADYDDQTLPQEASLEKLAVSFGKGCYLGQETVFMLEKRGHARKKLVRLAVEGDAELSAGAEIADPGGAAAGTVTSATRGADGGWLAIASVKHKLVSTGTELRVGERPARVLGPAADVHRA